MNQLLASIIAGFALSVSAYLYGRHEGRQAADGEAAIAERVAEKAAQASREEAAKAISAITVRHQTIRQELEREIRTVPVYTDPNCAVTADGLRNINKAIAPGSVASDPKLPDSSPAR